MAVTGVPSRSPWIRNVDDATLRRGSERPAWRSRIPGSVATTPAIRNESHTAAPATAPASPSKGEDPGSDHGADRRGRLRLARSSHLDLAVRRRYYWHQERCSSTLPFAAVPGAWPRPSAAPDSGDPARVSRTARRKARSGCRSWRPYACAPAVSCWVNVGPNLWHCLRMSTDQRPCPGQYRPAPKRAIRQFVDPLTPPDVHHACLFRPE